MQPGNYTTKALEHFTEYSEVATPLSQRAFRFLADKLRQAEVFVLPDHGELLDRSKPKPEVPGQAFKPPFPVVAMEFSAVGARPEHGIYPIARSSRRIALAWDASLGMPFPDIASPADYGDGVVIAPLAYMDDTQRWLPTSGGAHLPYDGEWLEPERTPFLDRAKASKRGFEGRVVPLLPEVLAIQRLQLGEEEAFNQIHMDLSDELNAYLECCIALACSNVSAERNSVSEKLNRARLKSGKLPFKDFHVLKIGGHGEGEHFGDVGIGGVRSHLRRGHIRRLSPERITWVNACMVRGRRPGFVDKIYAPQEVVDAD